jgi:glycogen debranching enzyme
MSATTISEARRGMAAERLVSLPDSIVIKDGNTFLLSDRDGSIRPPTEDSPVGLYMNDCRYLSHYEMLVANSPPMLLVASDSPGTSAIHELTNDHFEIPGEEPVARQCIQLRLTREIRDASRLCEELMIQSFEHRPLEFELVLLFSATFDPMMALRGIVKGRPVPEIVMEHEPAGISYWMDGGDGARRSLEISIDGAPVTIGDDMATIDIALEARGSASVSVEIAMNEVASESTNRFTLSAPSGRGVGALGMGDEQPSTSVTVDGELFGRVLQRSLLDINLLRSSISGRNFYAAGLPWYATLFGRDSLITALELLAYDREGAAALLRLHAELLGQREDEEHAEEPGKVLHELRLDETANMGLTAFARYYGSVDATPLFVCLLCDYVDWSGDLKFFKEMRGAIDAAVSWCDRQIVRHGMLMYPGRDEDALRNQGWKDSHEGIPDENGGLMPGPIALVEAQGYAIRAKRRLATLFDRTGDIVRAAVLRQQADHLATELDHFWLEPEDFFAMALDGNRRPSRALGSNQGHLLWAAAISPERAAGVRDALMDRRQFCGWGIRTLSEDEPGYNPVGYHIGSVWPHDNALIAHGLRKYGFDDDFNLVFEGILEAASRFPNYRLPELFAGFSKRDYTQPVPYPVACHPQAWAAGAIPQMMSAGLGLSPNACEKQLKIVRPTLPPWVRSISMRDLRVGDASANLDFVRTANGSIALSDVQVDGELEVSMEFSRPLSGPSL